MRKKALGCFVLALVTIACTSCQILPQEEELPVAPVINEYEGVTYKMTTVCQGDLVQSKTVESIFMPLKQEIYYFPVNGETIKGIYVKQGQQVQAGYLIAELTYDDLEEQILEIEYEIKVLALKKQHLLENQSLELQYSAENKELIELKYAQQIKEIEESISAKQQRLEETKLSFKEKQVFATISGMIEISNTLYEGQTSDKTKEIAAIYDRSSEFFYIKGDDAKYFELGSSHTVTVWGKDYFTTVVRGSSYGLPENIGNGIPIVYLRLNSSDYSIQKDSRGKIEIILDQRTDVLYVDKSAIHTNSTNGEQFVYVLDEDGMKVMQTVTTGLETDENIEITSGLKKGDSIVLE